MRPDYPIKTDRLLLRPFQAGDLDDFYAYRGRPDVYRYLDGEAPDRTATAELLAEKMTHHDLTKEGQRLTFAVYWPEADRVIGDVVLMWLNEEHRQGELGYIFNPEFHGKGLAREAAQAILHLGFHDLGLHRIIAQCAPRWRARRTFSVSRMTTCVV